jgi:peptidoglycan/LPS O-acetylase OafA/YrhL
MFLYTILIAMLFYHSEDIDRKNTLQKRFVLYLGNYSFGIFLIHIFFMYLCTEYLLAADNAFDADFLSAAVRFDAGIESWEYGNTGAASFSRAADREG